MKVLKRLDISKFAETALRTPKAVMDFLYQVATLTPGILFLFDLQKRNLIFANDQLYEILGYKISEINAIKGDIEKNLVHPDDYALSRKDRLPMKSLAFGKVMTMEYRLKKKSGEWVPVRLKGLLLEKGGKKSTLMLGLVEDLTQAKALEDQRRKEKQQALQTEKLAALNDMAGGIAHEINNPLAIILGRAQALRMRLEKGSVDPKNVMDGLQKIEATVLRISNIISALRLVTRDGSKDPFIPTPLKTIVNDVQTIWSQRMLNNGIDFKINSFDEHLTVICRPAQLATAMINLVSNSFHAVIGQPNSVISIDILDQGDFVSVAVTDSGHGIPTEIRDRIFNPFFTTRPVGEGTGLGLTVAAGVLKEHQGQLVLDDRSKQTRFVMTIPKNFYRQVAAA